MTIFLFAGSAVLRKIAYRKIDQQIFEYQKNYLISKAYRLNQKLQNKINSLIDLSLFLSDFETIHEGRRRQYFDETLQKFIASQPDIYAVWAVFKPYSIDTYDKENEDIEDNITGQFVDTYVKNNQNITKKNVEISDYKLLNNYLNLFSSNKRVVVNFNITDPYTNRKDKGYITRFVAPVYNNGAIIGMR